MSDKLRIEVEPPAIVSLPTWAIVDVREHPLGCIIQHPPGDFCSQGSDGIVHRTPYRELARVAVKSIETGGVMGFPYAESPQTGENMWKIIPAFPKLRRWAGWVSERLIAGNRFIQIGNPDWGRIKPRTRWYPINSVQCIDTCSQKQAREFMESLADEQDRIQAKAKVDEMKASCGREVVG